MCEICGILSEAMNRREYVQIGFLLGIVIYICLAVSSSVPACTIWAAAGDVVKGKGSLIAKNRDNLSHLYTALKFVIPEKGFPFYGLFDTEADGYVTAGINEEGLAVVNTAANSVPKIKRHTATEDLTQRLLTSFGSVDAVLSEKGIFEKSHPAIYIIGDASKIASVEVAPGGKTLISVRERGIVTFTNHYTSSELTYANEQSSVSSALRLRRIRRLMSGEVLPFTIDHFIAYSNDKNGGSEGALWRMPHAPEAIRTLASWIIYMPPEGPSVLYVKIANQNEPEKVSTITVDKIFWRENGNADRR